MFDLDGTLVNTNDINYFAYKEALNEYNYDIGYEYFSKDCNGINYKVFLSNIIKNPDDMEPIHKRKKELYKKHIGKGKLNKPLIDMIKGLKKNGYKIALVSAANKQNIEDVLNHFKISDLFDLIVAQEAVVETKPSPECYVKTMDFFNEKPETCIIFEDSPIGIEAAERAKINYFIVKGYN